MKVPFEVQERPLLTFALAAYNQERFIEEAVASAFSQTYEPLEIILSDDSSQDDTFQVMQAIAANYRGSHKVILNRNETNLGIGRHINRIFELAHGHLVLFAAGDDISLPQRAQANYEAWEASHRKALCIYSGHSIIDSDGQPLKDTRSEYSWSQEGTITEELISVTDFFSSLKIRICGATTAWSPRIMDVFGPLSENLVHEDEVLALRTTCLGSFMRIAVPLVKYRIHDNNIFTQSCRVVVVLDEIDRQEVRNRRNLANRHQMYAAFISDLETARRKALISQACFEQAVEKSRQQQRLMKDQLDFHTSSFTRKCGLLLQLKKQGLPAENLRSLVAKLLPESSYRLLKYWKSRLLLP